MLKMAAHRKNGKNMRLIGLCLAAMGLLLVKFVWLPEFYQVRADREQLTRLRWLVAQQDQRAGSALADTESRLTKAAHDLEFISDSYYHADSANSAGAQLLASLQAYAAEAGFKIVNVTLAAAPESVAERHTALADVRGEGSRPACLRLLYLLAQSRPAHAVQVMRFDIPGSGATLQVFLRIAALWRPPAQGEKMTSFRRTVEPVLPWPTLAALGMFGADPVVRPAAASVSAAVPVATTFDPGMKLVGIILGYPRHVAILRLRDGTEHSVVAGASIDGVEVKEIRADQVVLGRGTAEAILQMGQ